MKLRPEKQKWAANAPMRHCVLTKARRQLLGLSGRFPELKEPRAPPSQGGKRGVWGLPQGASKETRFAERLLKDSGSVAQTPRFCGPLLSLG